MLKINHMSRKIAVGMLTALSLSVFTPTTTQAGVISSITNSRITNGIVNGAKVFGGACLTVGFLQLVFDNLTFIIESWDCCDCNHFLGLGTSVGFLVLSARLAKEGLNGFFSKNDNQQNLSEEAREGLNYKISEKVRKRLKMPAN